MKLLQRSLVARIIASLLAISGMALISVTLTMAMSNSSRGDAAAINVAGSLRMTVYQMMWALQRLEYAPDEASEEQLASLVASFDQRLNGTTLQLTIPADDSHESRT